MTAFVPERTKMTSYILVVEDEPSIRELIAFTCGGAGFEVKSCQCVQEAQVLVDEMPPMMILLDNMLPGTSGIDWLKALRAQEETKYLPVIMLTALGSEFDRVLGLDSGADDYIVKPFMPRELIARIKALLRRMEFSSDAPEDALIECGPIVIDETRHEIHVKGQLLALSAKEFDLMRLFVKNPGRVFTREILLSSIWNQTFIDERTVDVHILRLRKHLKEVQAEGLLQTVRGIGYKLDIETR